MALNKNKWVQVERILSKMPIEVCCSTVLPEFGVAWEEVSKAIRNTKLPMHPSSVARVLCNYGVKVIFEDKLSGLLDHLRLIMVAIQSRTWHVIHFLEPTSDEPIQDSLEQLEYGVFQSLKSVQRAGMRTIVQSLVLEDLLYFSIQFVSHMKESSTFYLATPPGQPVALVSSTTASKLLKACTKGLNYTSYEVADLFGQDKLSLLRIASQTWAAETNHLTYMPTYDPIPIVTKNGIDYTNKEYNKRYIDSIIGPNPPCLKFLQIKSMDKFFEPARLNKTIYLTVTVKSEDIASTLRTWALKGAITPTSKMFDIFHKIKSNRITYNEDVSNSD